MKHKSFWAIASTLLMWPVIAVSLGNQPPGAFPVSVTVQQEFNAQKFVKDVEESRSGHKKNIEKEVGSVTQSTQDAALMKETSNRLLTQVPVVQQTAEDIKEGKSGTSPSSVQTATKKVESCDCYDQRDPKNFSTNFIFDKKQQGNPDRLYRINPFCKCLPRPKSTQDAPVEPVATSYSGLDQTRSSDSSVTVLSPTAPATPPRNSVSSPKPQSQSVVNTPNVPSKTAGAGGGAAGRNPPSSAAQGQGSNPSQNSNWNINYR